MCTRHAVFLGLPFDLRYETYDECFDLWSPFYADPHKVISLVCRQITNEAFPVLLRDARSSNSIASFIAWTSGDRPKLLQHIEHLVCAWTVPSLTHLSHKVLDEKLQEDALTEPCSIDTTGGLERAFCSISNLRKPRLNLSITFEHHVVFPLIQSGHTRIKKCYCA